VVDVAQRFVKVHLYFMHYDVHRKFINSTGPRRVAGKPGNIEMLKYSL
jgi:hypothetical protein